jgi:hypothetical protein
VQFDTWSFTASGGGSCTNNIDFVNVNGGLGFAPGTTRQPITITICSDFLFEFEQTFKVRIYGPTGSTVARPEATVTIRDAPTGPPTISCSPRPRVGVQVARNGADEIQVTITAQSNGRGAANELRTLEFGPARNARIVIGGGEESGNFTQPLPGGATRTTFAVRRAGPGAFTVPLTVVDGCGDWSTFVGLGS